jgi:hypothetical protein
MTCKKKKIDLFNNISKKKKKKKKKKQVQLWLFRRRVIENVVIEPSDEESMSQLPSTPQKPNG